MRHGLNVNSLGAHDKRDKREPEISIEKAECSEVSGTWPDT